MNPSTRSPLRARLSGPLLALVAASFLAGCPDDGPDREEAAPPSEALPLSLALEVPSTVPADEDASIRITLENEGDVPVVGAGFDIALPPWLAAGEASDGNISARPVHSSELGSRIRVRHDAILRGGGSWTVTQPVRRQAPENDRFESRLVRAWLVDAEGNAIGAGVSQTMGRMTTTDVLPVATSEGVGTARLGAEVDALREAVVTRDTAWTEGAERMEGLAVQLADGVRVLAAVTEGTVVRVRVDDERLRSASGARPGVPLESLRTLYGDPCLVQEAGRTIAVFPTKPGVEFVLEEGERVSHLLIRRTARDCPADARTPGEDRDVV